MAVSAPRPFTDVHNSSKLRLGSRAVAIATRSRVVTGRIENSSSPACQAASRNDGNCSSLSIIGVTGISNSSGVAQPPHAIAENGPPAAVAVPRYDASPRPARAVTPRTKSIAPQVPAPEPEILIDPREMRTLQALIEGVRIGRIDLTAAQNSVSQVPAAPEPFTDIVIAPLTIEPIALVQGAEGVRP